MQPLLFLGVLEAARKAVKWGKKQYAKLNTQYAFVHAKEKRLEADFPGCPVVKDLPANTGDTSLSPGLGRSHSPQGS